MSTEFANPFTRTTQPLLIRPQMREYWLRLRLLAPLSHHDPAQGDKSNKSLFRRQKQFVHAADTGRLPTQGEIDALTALLPVPAEIAPFFQDLPLPQFVAAALVRLFVELYGSGDGEGLFSGIERYRRLEERLSQAATVAATLVDFWGIACRDLQVPIGPASEDRRALHLLSLPPTLGHLALHALQTAPRAVTMLGREWAATIKRQSADYAAKAGVDVAGERMVVLSYEASELESARRQLGLQVPTFSANSVRHEMVREPGMWHLLHRLGIGFDQLPPGVAALLYNGGNIEAGASAPTNAFALTQIVRDRYPFLSLVGGSVDGFLLGESNLRVNAWVICRENNDALQLAGLQSDVSIFDMLDEETLTRHAGRAGEGQMPFSFEVLAKGAEILVRLALTPYARPIEAGALIAAVETYRAADGSLGGQGARGFGLVSATWHDPLTEEDLTARAAYEAFLDERADALRQGLLDGTLGTDKVICK